MLTHCSPNSFSMSTMVPIPRGVPRIWEGGAKNFFFQIWEFACREATCCAWRSTFLKRCNLVHFRVYFDQILSLFFFKNYHFLYEKINILDTRLLWGISYEEIFENMLRLMRFGIYFETKKAIFIKK